MTFSENLSVSSFTDSQAFSTSFGFELYKNRGTYEVKNKDGTTTTETDTKPDEIFESIEVSGIPDGSEFSYVYNDFVGTGTISSSSPTPVDQYTLTKDYVSPRLVITSDMYVSLLDLNPCTEQTLREQIMHYTGKSWAYKGLLAYQTDGNTLTFDILAKVKYKIKTGTKTETDPETGDVIKTEDTYSLHEESKTYSLVCQANASAEQFKKLYKENCTPIEEQYRVQNNLN